jgi:CBS domain-containing protein
MLTDILRFEVTDDRGRRARVSDLVVALLEDDYPPITGLLVNENDSATEIAWSDVADIDANSRTITVKDLQSSKDVADDCSFVLLKRDILDALILDLLGRRTTRVSDLLLEVEDGRLRLKGADAGMSAMLRRVFRGRWTRPNPKEIFDWKYVEFLRGDPAAVHSGEGYRLRINRLPAGEIARLADYIPYLHAAELLKLLPDAKAARVLESTPIERQLQIVEELDENEAINILGLMSPDLAADVIGRLEVNTMRRYLNLMPKQRSRLITELLRYPEDSVGGVMTNDLLIIPVDTSCTNARHEIESRLEKVRFDSLVFIVDTIDDKKLRGAISLKDMWAAEDNVMLEAIMDPYLQTLDPFSKAVDAAYRIVTSQLPAMAVVDGEGRILGAMTVEAAISRLVPNTSALQQVKVFS